MARDITSSHDQYYAVVRSKQTLVTPHDLQKNVDKIERKFPERTVSIPELKSYLAGDQQPQVVINFEEEELAEYVEPAQTNPNEDEGIEDLPFGFINLQGLQRARTAEVDTEYDLSRRNSANIESEDVVGLEGLTPRKVKSPHLRPNQHNSKVPTRETPALQSDAVSFGLIVPSKSSVDAAIVKGKTEIKFLPGHLVTQDLRKEGAQHAGRLDDRPLRDALQTNGKSPVKHGKVGEGALATTSGIIEDGLGSIAKNRSSNGLPARAKLIVQSDRSKSLKKERNQAVFRSTEPGNSPTKVLGFDRELKSGQEALYPGQGALSSEQDKLYAGALGRTQELQGGKGHFRATGGIHEHLIKEEFLSRDSRSPGIRQSAATILNSPLGSKLRSSDIFSPVSSDTYMVKRPTARKVPKQKKIYLPAVKPNIEMINQIKGAYAVSVPPPNKKSVKLPSLRKKGKSGSIELLGELAN